jgi:NAD(P)H-dependent FMN reductase
VEAMATIEPIKKIKILSLVGGISNNSLNQKLFKTFKKTASEKIELTQFNIENLPFFNQDIENDPPAVVRELKQQVQNANAILFITPEYNRSFPGVLKNAIDWTSRPYGQNLWDRKAAAIAGASVGNIGTFGAQHHLRQVLSYLNVQTMGQPEFYLNASKVFDKDGEMTDESTKQFILKFWKSFESWIEIHTQNKL